RAGGVSGFLAIDALCAPRGVALSPHGVGTSVGVAAALHTCRVLSAFGVYEANRLLNPMRDELGCFPSRMEEGALLAADRPGHGGEPDPGRLAAYLLTMTSEPAPGLAPCGS